MIVGSTHGHEKIGQYVSEELQKFLREDSGVEFVIGNPKASVANVRFIESDLNRIFPGKADGDYEEKLAYELSSKILDADLVIDIHSTNTTDFGDNSMLILTKFDEATKRIVEIIKPPKVLVMKYKNNKNLISQAKIGIGFEYGMDESKDVLNATLNDIANILISFRILKENPFTKIISTKETEVFEVYDAFEKNFTEKFIFDDQNKNFQLIKKGGLVGNKENGESIFATEDFYPVMFGENSYKTILGFKARKINNT